MVFERNHRMKKFIQLSEEPICKLLYFKGKWNQNKEVQYLLESTGVNKVYFFSCQDTS